MTRKIAVFDIDGTLFRSGLYREVFYELYKMGVLPNDLTEQTTEKHRHAAKMRMAAAASAVPMAKRRVSERTTPVLSPPSCAAKRNSACGMPRSEASVAAVMIHNA